MKKTIITVIGPDKPGIIASVSDTLFKRGCNIENISQTTLQSEFAGICVVSIPLDLSIETLREDMKKELLDQNLHVHIKALDEAHIKRSTVSTEPFIISTCGPDKQGIVALISRIIADAGVNISNLKAVFEGGSNPDRNIMIFEVDIPASTDLQMLSENLKQNASKIGLDLTIQHKNIFDAVNRI
jgi:glycine cleavage system transcriptional repressor